MICGIVGFNSGPRGYAACKGYLSSGIDMGHIGHLILTENLSFCLGQRAWWWVKSQTARSELHMVELPMNELIFFGLLLIKIQQKTDTNLIKAKRTHFLL